MKHYDVFYGKILRLLEKYPRLVLVILSYNWLVTKLMYLLYPLLLVYLYSYHREDLLTTFIVPAIGFALLTLFRKHLNQPRPYQTWQIKPVMKRDGSGDSFPSRHVFSASLISMCFLSQFFWIGIFLLIVTLGLALCRVIGGVHYPKDVLVGYVLGVLWGMLLFL